ncbi:MAG: hypothetical protein J3K34DRAFT_520175 [Monoraphidium minutum]|nr:MAG: hypothetical protein J3K34DRAFT_520175 [Monoraphidium minutum]
MEKIQAATLEVERLGELFLMNKEQILQADRQRQGNREALAALRRQQRGGGGAGGSGAGASSSSGSSGGGGAPQKRVWLLPSAAPAGGPGAFTKLPAADAARRIEADQERLEARLAELRAAQKRLTAALADRGAGPEGAGEGLLRAMLNLKDSGGGIDLLA